MNRAGIVVVATVDQGSLSWCKQLYLAGASKLVYSSWSWLEWLEFLEWLEWLELAELTELTELTKLIKLLALVS